MIRFAPQNRVETQYKTRNSMPTIQQLVRKGRTRITKKSKSI